MFDLYFCFGVFELALDFGDERRRATMARMNLREMIFMFHLFGRFGRVRRCSVPLVLGDDHPGHLHTQTDPTCSYAQSSGPAPLHPFPAAGPVSVAS